VVVADDKRLTIQHLGEHVVYDASNNMAMMSTQLLSFLLLTKFRKGATLRQLVPEMNWLREEAVKRKREVGFTGDSADVIRYASNLLGRNLVSTEVVQMAWSSSESSEDSSNRMKKIVLLKPVNKLAAIMELQYYSNSVINVFLLDSIVASALFSLLDCDLESVKTFANCKKNR
jgi:glycerol-3-phosphate O-acyltransferase 1/2